MQMFVNVVFARLNLLIPLYYFMDITHSFSLDISDDAVVSGLYLRCFRIANLLGGCDDSLFI
jgi:hypothetical protein